MTTEDTDNGTGKGSVPISATDFAQHECADDPLFEQAAALFLQYQEAKGNPAQEASVQLAIAAWINNNRQRQVIFGSLSHGWDAIGDHATAPEIVVARAEALHHARSSAGKRWRSRRTGVDSVKRLIAIAAAVLLLIIPLSGLLLFGESGQQTYQTAIGETRVITLQDNSRLSMDAKTHVAVNYSESHRDIRLLMGQAHFVVANDPLRPFRVIAGDQTVVALGTVFNVELMADQVLVTLVEGRVAVTETPARLQSADTGQTTTDIALPTMRGRGVRELTPGQQLVVNTRDKTRYRQQLKDVDLEKSTAWRLGKLMFQEERLIDAVARINRYSHIRVVIDDDAIRGITVNGVFNAGDTEAFVTALVEYFDITSDQVDNNLIILRSKG